MTETAPVNRPDIFIVGTMKGGTTILHEFAWGCPKSIPAADDTSHCSRGMALTGITITQGCPRPALSGRKSG